MLQDTANMQVKGHVKLELYNDQEGVFFTKEKKNLVVQSANKIVANIMSDPAKTIRISQVDRGDSSLSADANGLYSFGLTIKHEAKGVLQRDFASNNEEKTVTIEGALNLTKLYSVKVGPNDLVIGEDVYISDADKGEITFKVAPKAQINVEYQYIKNPYMMIIEGTQKVKVDGEEFTVANTPSVANKQYSIDVKTGYVYFDAAVEKVEVSYDYKMHYSLGFMSLGGRPKDHPEHRPVEFGLSEKLKTHMEAEFPNARQAIQFPSQISHGAKEVEVIPCQPIRSVVKSVNRDVVVDTLGDKQLEFSLNNVHNSGSGDQERLLLKLVKVTNTTTGAVFENEDLADNFTVSQNSLAGVKVTMDDSVAEVGETLRFEYELQLDNEHLVYQLGQSPCVELLSVKHTSSVDGSITEYNIIDKGLRFNEGDVWIMNSNSGKIQFSRNPSTGVPVHTPGQLTIEYRVNSGTVVRFVADFPKGVPAPTLELDTCTHDAVVGQTSFTTNYPIAKDEFGEWLIDEVRVAGTKLNDTQYTVATDGRSVSPQAVQEGDEVVIVYEYERDTHDIYQVAMFDNKVGGEMFNISGIGPVTKDKNTGMRVTWSVTF